MDSEQATDLILVALDTMYLYEHAERNYKRMDALDELRAMLRDGSAQVVIRE